MTGFYAVPLFGLVEAVRAVRAWLDAPDLPRLAQWVVLGAVATGLSVHLDALSAWLWFYLLFGVAGGALMRRRPEESVAATWVPVLFVAPLCAAELIAWEVMIDDPGSWSEGLSLVWGSVLAVVAFRYSKGVASGCSTLFGAMIAWFFATLFVGFLRDLVFGGFACVLGLLLPGPPEWLGPFVETLTQIGFDTAALGIVWLAAAIAQEDVLAGHEPDAGLYLKLVRERMLRTDIED